MGRVIRLIFSNSPEGDDRVRSVVVKLSGGQVNTYPISLLYPTELSITHNGDSSDQRGCDAVSDLNKISAPGLPSTMVDSVDVSVPVGSSLVPVAGVSKPPPLSQRPPRQSAKESRALFKRVAADQESVYTDSE